MTIERITQWDDNSRNEQLILALYDEVEDTADAIVDAYNKTETDDLLDKKADKTDTYTKTEVDGKIAGGGIDAYTKTESDGKYRLITDSYTKTQVDAELNKKANTSDVYTKRQVDGKIPSVPDSYTKTESDGRYYTQSQIDGKIPTVPDISGKADKTYVDTELNKKANTSDIYTRTQIDSAISNANNSGLLLNREISATGVHNLDGNNRFSDWNMITFVIIGRTVRRYWVMTLPRQMYAYIITADGNQGFEIWGGANVWFRFSYVNDTSFRINSVGGGCQLSAILGAN